VGEQAEIELVFEPQDEGGYHVYAPELPGLHTQGDDLEDAVANAEEALALYVEGLREDGESLEFGVIRRRFQLPA
jgi:predicted RNase H-like HicB family nuclease